MQRAGIRRHGWEPEDALREAYGHGVRSPDAVQIFDRAFGAAMAEASGCHGEGTLGGIAASAVPAACCPA